ncbi:hypothetical protein HK104_002423 [Borealophlyctis nickersoniae]|nr:hypothetical protein HK104_002423 [Borealophlyctis nickersoniae]
MHSITLIQQENGARHKLDSSQNTAVGNSGKYELILGRKTFGITEKRCSREQGAEKGPRLRATASTGPQPLIKSQLGPNASVVRRNGVDEVMSRNMDYKLQNGDGFYVLKDQHYFQVEIDPPVGNESKAATKTGLLADSGTESETWDEMPPPVSAKEPEKKKQSWESEAEGAAPKKIAPSKSAPPAQKKRRSPSLPSDSSPPPAPKRAKPVSKPRPKPRRKKAFGDDDDDSGGSAGSEDDYFDPEDPDFVVDDDEMDEDDEYDDDEDEDIRRVCQYGKSCYRKNPAHFAEFAHPWLDDDPGAPKGGAKGKRKSGGTKRKVADEDFDDLGESDDDLGPKKSKSYGGKRVRAAKRKPVNYKESDDDDDDFLDNDDEEEAKPKKRSATGAAQRAAPKAPASPAKKTTAAGKKATAPTTSWIPRRKKTGKEEEEEQDEKASVPGASLPSNASPPSSPVKSTTHKMLDHSDDDEDDKAEETAPPPLSHSNRNQEEDSKPEKQREKQPAQDVPSPTTPGKGSDTRGRGSDKSANRGRRKRSATPVLDLTSSILSKAGSNLSDAGKSTPVTPPNGVVRLAFPAISVAEGKVGADIAAECAYKAITAFQRKYPTADVEFVLVESNPDVIEAFRKKFSSDGNLSFVNGNMTTLKSSAGKACRFLAVETSWRWKPTATAHCKAVHERAGAQLLSDVKTVYTKPAQIGEAYPVRLDETSPLRQEEGVEQIIHVVGPNLNPGRPHGIEGPNAPSKAEQLLQSTYDAVLESFATLAEIGGKGGGTEGKAKEEKNLCKS